MKNKKIPDSQITVYKMAEGKINIVVLYSSSTTEDYSIVQLKGKSHE